VLLALALEQVNHRPRGGAASAPDCPARP
jgi:hypothetical protein